MMPQAAASAALAPPRRRRPLVAAALTEAEAARAAIVPPALLGVAAADEQDAELFAMVAKLLGGRASFAVLLRHFYDGMGRRPKKVNMQVRRDCDDLLELVKQIGATPARSMAGVQAKAAALISTVVFQDDGAGLGRDYLPAALARDILRLIGPDVGAIKWPIEQMAQMLNIPAEQTAGPGGAQ